MLANLHLQNIGPAPEMRFDFAPRLNVLAGDNGLGKSFVLDIAWWALTQTWPSVTSSSSAVPNPQAVIRYHIQRNGRAKAAEAIYDFDEGRWSVLSLPVNMPELSSDRLVLYARVDGGVSLWDRRRRWNSKRALRADDLGREHAFLFRPEDIWDSLRSPDDPSRVLCNGMIADWRTWQLEKNAWFEMLKQVLTLLSPQEPILPEDRAVRVAVDDARDIPTIRLSYGSVPITHASAGMRRILSLAYLLVWSWREHLEASRLRNLPPVETLVLLVDEVESHLHPKWQRCILPALLSVVAALEPSLSVQILAVTHSPLVLASLEPLFDEARDALFVLDVDDSHHVAARHEPWVRRGSANAWLTSDVFELKQPGSIEAERAIEDAKRALLDSSLSLDQIRAIHHRLHAVLKDTDPFWPRWLARAEAAGVAP